MRTVQIYVGTSRVELFNDEKISITSSVQNINDIGKTFTDFSQSFTIPASPSNNAIFSHWYESAITNGFDAKVRSDSTIYINETLFRKGQLQLEGAEVKDNEVLNYKVTFYGDVTTLKDLFGEDKLSDLDYTAIAATFDGATVKTAISSTGELDVRYPLISSNKVWTYGDVGANDINEIGTPLQYTELFPAVRVKAIMDLIETKYGVTFAGTFFDSNKFKRLYTWWKNTKYAESVFSGAPVLLTWAAVGGGEYIDTNVVNLNYIDPTSLIPAGAVMVGGNITQGTKLYLNPSTSDEYWVDKFNDGVYVGTFPNTPNQGYTGTQTINLQGSVSAGNENQVSYKVKSYNVMSFTVQIKYWQDYYYTLSGTTYHVTESTSAISSPISGISTTTDIDFNSSAPDIRIADYFAGVLKMFNLMCYPITDDLTFQVEPLEMWYNYGGQVDITPYVITDSIKYDRPKLYKEISFTYEKSKNFLNEKFAGLFTREYGSLKYELGYDGGKLEIKVPFEIPLFQKFTDENLQVAYCLTEEVDGKAYVPKCTMLYLDYTTTCSFRFYDGSSTTEVTTYVPFGQDTVFNLEDYSINFGDDFSSLKEDAIDNSLYLTYYEPYLANLFSKKTRIVTLKAILPLPMLSTLTMDDAIFIRDKKYRINTLKTDLTSGVCDLELITDLVKGKGKPIKPPVIPYTGGTIVVPIRPVKPIIPTKSFGGGGGTFSVLAPLETSFTSGTPALPISPREGEIELSFALASNGTGSTRINTIPIVYYDADKVAISTEYIVFEQVADTNRLITESGLSILTETLDYLITE